MTERMAVDTSGAFLTMREMMARSRMSRQLLLRAERRGLLTLLRPSRKKTLVEREELDRYLKSCTK
jgi:hypothetical protein